jgi:hypothetical protein
MLLGNSEWRIAYEEERSRFRCSQFDIGHSSKAAGQGKDDLHRSACVCTAATANVYGLSLSPVTDIGLPDGIA